MTRLGAWVASRRFRIVAAGILLMLAALPLGGMLLVSQVLARECAELPREDLSLREMAQLRRRLEAYKQDPVSPLVLTPREASFLVREQFDILAWLDIDGTEMHLESRLPGEGRCLNVTFRGSFDIRERVARVVPNTLHLGSLDVSWLVRGRELAVPESIVTVPGPGAVELFTHVISVEIQGGKVVVRVDDPEWID